jgi:hypothetical protein
MTILLSKRAENQLESLIKDNKGFGKEFTYFLKVGHWKEKGKTIADFLRYRFEGEYSEQDLLNKISSLQTKTDIYISTYNDLKIFYTSDSKNFVIIEIVRDSEIHQSAIQLESLELASKRQDLIKSNQKESYKLINLKKMIERKNILIQWGTLVIVVISIIILILRLAKN